MVQGVDGFTLGYKTDIGAFCYIQAKEGVEIQDFVQVGSHCAIYSVSTIDGKKGRVVLKENCRIGSHTTILPGVTIGKNAIIGAHSLVNRDIPDNVLAFGVPVQIIRSLEG
jgi:acetyltransferase-like isoleucine patch superfamily enzyme